MWKDLSSSDANDLIPGENQEELDREEELLYEEVQLQEQIRHAKKILPSYLPSLDNSIDTSKKFVNLKESDKYLDTPYEDIENFMFNPELTKEYERIKNEYKDLINMFQTSIEQDAHINKKTKQTHNFNSLEEFDNAINSGKVNLDKYNIKEINELMLELTKLEENVYNRDLEDYGLVTVKDFHKAVESGILNLNKYEIKDINKLLEKLEDDGKIELHEYNLMLFGDISIGEIHIKVQHGIRDYSKLSGLDGLPSTDIYEELVESESLQRMIRKPKPEDPLEEIYVEDYQIEQNFVDKLSSFVKGLFKRKKDP